MSVMSSYNRPYWGDGNIAIPYRHRMFFGGASPMVDAYEQHFSCRVLHCANKVRLQRVEHRLLFNSWIVGLQLKKQVQ